MISRIDRLADDRARALALTPVSRETEKRLETLVELLLKWQKSTNLVANSTVEQVWFRHIADSLQLLPLAPGARHWIDLGSGAGFPGLVIACALADTPGAKVHLVESNAKKAAFLGAAVRMTGAPALVHAQRITDLMKTFSESVDAVTARALAPLKDLMGYAEPFLKDGAKAFFPKGQDVEAELAEAAKSWDLGANLVPSKTSPEGRIVIVSHAERRRLANRDGQQ